MDLTSERSLTVVEKERWTVVLVSMVVLDGTEVPAGEYMERCGGGTVGGVGGKGCDGAQLDGRTGGVHGRPSM